MEGLGEPGRARGARSLAEGPREGPGMSEMPLAAKISSKRLGVQETAGCCAATTEAQVEAPNVCWMPMSIENSSRTLGVPRRAGCTPALAEAPGEGACMSRMPMATKGSSRRLFKLGRLGGWGCGSSGGVMPSP